MFEVEEDFTSASDGLSQAQDCDEEDALAEPSKAEDLAEDSPAPTGGCLVQQSIQEAG